MVQPPIFPAAASTVPFIFTFPALSMEKFPLSTLKTPPERMRTYLPPLISTPWGRISMPETMEYLPVGSFICSQAPSLRTYCLPDSKDAQV